MQFPIEAKIDAILAAEIEPGGPGAAIAVTRASQFTHRKAYGLANLEWGVPLNPNSVFRIASLTKQFTAVAIMMLAERGQLPSRRRSGPICPTGRGGGGRSPYAVC